MVDNFILSALKGCDVGLEWCLQRSLLRLYSWCVYLCGSMGTDSTNALVSNTGSIMMPRVLTSQI